MDNWRRQITLSCLIGIIASTSIADTNFVHALNQKWAQHDVTNLLAFVENSAATNACLETITAKGIVYGFILTWGVNSTNLFEEARVLAQTSSSPCYSDFEKAGIGNCTRFLSESFVSIAALGGGTLNDYPTTNTVYIDELFELYPDKPPFGNYLELFATLGTP